VTRARIDLFHSAAHAGQAVAESDVALQGIAMQALDGDLPARDRGGAQK
jgi:hypothetical protein